MKPHHKSMSDSNDLHHRAKIRRALGIIGVVAMTVLVSGCASIATSDKADPWQFNAQTGYPAVGGPSWGRF
jgi:hypothetical protein